jgi:outer membrane protein
MALVAILFAAGCQSIPDDTASPAPRNKLTGIDTVNLADLSETDPVSVEQATEQTTDQIADPNAAVPEIKLTLEQVRAATLANNLDLKTELISPALAQTSVDEERARFEAAFFGSAGVSRSESIGSDTITNSAAYQVGIDQPLTTGGTITLAVPFSDSDPDDSAGVADAAVSVSYIQSLLRGAGTSINTQSIRIALLQSQRTDATTKLTAINLLASADATYWYLYAARKELEVRREQYKLAQDQLTHAEKKVASGSAAKIEIVRAEAGLASRLEGVINAENSLESAERELRRIMNRPDLPLNATTRIIPQTEPHPLGLKLNEERLIEFALANRMDMIRLERQLAIDELAIEAARNATLPDLTLSSDYSASNQGTGLNNSFNRFTSGRADDLSVGLSASIPLGNKAARARLRRARLIRIQDRTRRDQRKQFIEQDVQEAISNLESNWRSILAAEQGVKAAYRDYRVEQSQFQLGVRNSTDVLYSATRLADAQLGRIRAYAQYEIAQIDLARATGTLLGHGRIQIEPFTLDG